MYKMNTLELLNNHNFVKNVLQKRYFFYTMNIYKAQYEFGENIRGL